MAEFKRAEISSLPSDNLLIVDALNLAFRWKHQGLFVFVTDYLKTVESLARSYNCGTIVIAADQGGSVYRREIFPDYKANRKELYANDTAEQREATRKFFDEYERVIEACDQKFKLLRYNGVEADDIAGYLVNRRVDYGFDQVWLISSDRDWDLLVDENVNRFSTVTRKNKLWIPGITLSHLTNTSPISASLGTREITSLELKVWVPSELPQLLNSTGIFSTLLMLAHYLENTNTFKQLMRHETSYLQMLS